MTSDNQDQPLAAGKPLLTSVTIWGALLTLAAALLPHLGLELADPQGLAADLAAAAGARFLQQL